MVTCLDLSYTTKGEGGLINFPPLKRGGLLESGGGAYLRGGLNRGFTVC